jgi:23S rRNA (pseudouridine1915-N3)-methyltransferase
MKIHILFVGKPREKAANDLAAEYVKRISRYAACEMREIDPSRYDPWARNPAAVKVGMDPAVKGWDSGEFAQWLSRLEDGGRDVVFLVGGHDGLLPVWRERCDLLVSLSPMTYPHELARVMLTEQIYRAFTSLRGHPYAR